MTGQSSHKDAQRTESCDLVRHDAAAASAPSARFLPAASSFPDSLVRQASCRAKSELHGVPASNA
eukprot:364218-Chlamydomonas_euryale.AAC.3